MEILASIKNAGMEKSRVTIETVKGENLVKDTEKPKGHPDNPLGYDEVVKKFKSLASKVISSDRIDQIIEKVSGLEGMRNINELAKLLQK